MKNTVLTFGVYSGLVSGGLMLATVPFTDQIGFDRGVFVGYTAMLISFLFVYFGVRKYRDTVLGGRMTFATAFNVGILITLISCAFYVGTWLVVYFFLMPDFGAKFGEYLVESARLRGASPAELETTARQAAEYRVLLNNPLTNAAYTFIEPFPVGLLVTLTSATVLRKPAAAS